MICTQVSSWGKAGGLRSRRPSSRIAGASSGTSSRSWQPPFSVATFIAWSEFENPLIDVYCAELSFRLAHAKRKSPPTMWLPGHNHISAIAHIGTSDDGLGKAIVDFIRHPR